MHRKDALYILIFMSICITGCRGPNDPIPLRAPGIDAPWISDATPINGELTFYFTIPVESHVSLWVSRGVAPNQEEPQVNHSIGLFYNASGIAIRTLINEQKSAGDYFVEWDTRDDNGLPVPEGHYRIYLRANDFLRWKDVAILRN